MTKSVRWHWWLPVLLFLAALALYAPAVHFAFLNYDDPTYVTANLHVRDGLTLAGIEWALRSRESANWFPLTWISHMADVQFFGLTSGLHHLTNVVLHAAAAVLLFVLLFRATGAVWRPALVAAIFALHPLHVESVAWIAERKDVLSAFFWMLALLAYVRFVERPIPRRYALLLAAFSAGLMSKSMIVTLPVVALLLDFWPLRRAMSKALITEKLPLFGLSAAACALVVLAQRGAGAVLSVDQLPVSARLANALVSYVVYAAKLFWPTNLAVFYPFPASLPAWRAVAAGAALLAVSALAIHQRGRRPFLLVGWLWYLATLLPVIGIVQVGLQARADRYTYIPLIGLSIGLAWGAADLGSSRPRAVAAIAFTAVIAWAAAARSYLSAWHDSAGVFEHAIAATGGNYVACNNLGVALRDRGDAVAAMTQFRAALAIRPEYDQAQNNLGESLLRQGRPEDALVHIAEALRLNPSLPEAHVNLGAILSRQGRTEEAVSQYRIAIELGSANAEAHGGLGAIFTDLGRFEDAVQELTVSARLKPGEADAHYNLGRLYGLTGRTAEAIAEFSRTVALRPDDPESHYNLGVARASAGQLDRALDEFRAAIRLSPGYVNAHFNLGIALAQSGNCAAAIPEFAEALRFRPQFVEARQNIAACREVR